MTCTWEPDEGCLTDEWDMAEPEDKARALMLATSSLMGLTNNRVGTCPETVRPCPESRPCPCWGYPSPAWVGPAWAPVNWNGQWFNCVHCGRKCKATSKVELPGPVGYIDSIKIDGAEQDLDSGDWRLDNGHILVWQGEGPSPIPATQNLDLPDTAPGTWSVTYSRSYAVGPEGRLAVAMLAMEFLKACKPKGKCSLPTGVTNVVRNGVSFTIEAGLFPGGLTGIKQADVFILKWNPPGSPSHSAQVFDPRKAPVRRQGALPKRPVVTP